MRNTGMNVKYLDVKGNEAIYRDQRDRLQEASEQVAEQEDTHGHF